MWRGSLPDGPHRCTFRLPQCILKLRVAFRLWLATSLINSWFGPGFDNWPRYFNRIQSKAEERAKLFQPRHRPPAPWFALLFYDREHDRLQKQYFQLCSSRWKAFSPAPISISWQLLNDTPPVKWTRPYFFTPATIWTLEPSDPGTVIEGLSLVFYHPIAWLKNKFTLDSSM